MKLIVGLLLSIGMLFGMVDINKADVKELTTLKGIGKGKAVKIVKYREMNGCFKDTMELTKVQGIGKGLIQKNQDLITITTCQ